MSVKVFKKEKEKEMKNNDYAKAPILQLTGKSSLAIRKITIVDGVNWIICCIVCCVVIHTKEIQRPF